MDELLKLMIDDIKHQIELIKIHKKVCDILETRKLNSGCMYRHTSQWITTTDKSK